MTDLDQRRLDYYTRAAFSLIDWHLKIWASWAEHSLHQIGIARAIVKY